jgi:hypothetical protein
LPEDVVNAIGEFFAWRSPSMHLITCVLAIALLAGCASQPSTPTPAPAAAPGVAQAVATAPSAVVASAAAEGKARAPAGYKTVERSGVTFFCTNVATVGTKFKKEICMTEGEYVELQRRGASVRQDMQKNATICGGAVGGACGGG